MKKLYLIDGMAFVFRAYHAMRESELKSPDGMPSGAILGFVNTITYILEKEKPENVAVVFDTRQPTFRHKLFPDYKAHRDEFPEDLGPQLEKIKDFLDLTGIPRIEFPGYEADDVIGTFAKMASKEGIEVICMTSDKDYYQLVDDNISLLKPAFRGMDFISVSYPEVEKKFGVMPGKVIDVMALMGDSSDNIPGVKGVGEKTAIPLIQEFGSVENLYENLDKIERKAVLSKLEINRDNAFLSKFLVTIKIDVPVKENLDDLKPNDPQFVELDKFFKSLGFTNIRKKWFERSHLAAKDYFPDDVEQENDMLNINTANHDYRLVSAKDEMCSMVKDLENRVTLSFDLETSSLDRNTCDIVGIALCAEEGKAYYVSVDDRDALNSEAGQDKNSQDSLFGGSEAESGTNIIFDNCLPVGWALEQLRPLLENNKINKCGQNAKFDTYILSRYGIDVRPVSFDSMLASYILNPDEKHGMDALARKWLNYETVPISALIGQKKSEQKSMRDINPDDIKDYACEDADITLQLCNVLGRQLEKENLIKLAAEVEFPMVEVLTRVERNGVAIDTKALGELSVSITKRAKELTKEIYAEAGVEFNIDSPKQVGHVLFEKLMLPSAKKTKTGYSTDVQVLTKLAETFPIAKMMLEYRQLTKLKSTYVDTLPKLINPEAGRIHTTYNQAVASTGRLSSTAPNLQNIPIRTDLGKEIRKAFVPGRDGNVMFSADYSQVELRIMAYICDDRHMIDGFIEGLDVHSATSATLFDVELAEVTPDMRRIAKTVNFGIMYGLGAFGLSQRLGMNRNEAKEIIDNYFIKYPGIRQYINDTIEKTRQKEYAETLLGRRRYFPLINAKNKNLQKAAERGAINMPIQGTAADMMKIAMIAIDKEMRKRNMQSMMLLQVHDELVFEVPENELGELEDVVVSGMQNALPLGEVPVVVDTGAGGNWFEAH